MKARAYPGSRIDAGRMSRRALVGGGLALGGAAALSPLAGVLGGPSRLAAARQDAAAPGGSLRVGLYLDAATMDPHFSGSKVDRQIYFNVYDPLVTLAEDLSIQPGLAESWEAPDPTTYVFHLREGVTFHDGTAFDAAAVKVNFDRMMDPELKSLRRGDVAGIESVEVVDPLTVTLHLAEPNSALLATLTDRAGMMISPAAIEQFGEELARNPVGTGPFKFVEWQKDDSLHLERNTDYWMDGLPHLDEIRYRVILDDSVRIAALKNHEIDMVDYVPPKFVADTRADANLQTIDIPSLAVWFIWLNTTAPPFDNKALREAFASAIDIAPIVERIYLGIGKPANGPISPASWAYAKDVPVRPRDLDFARAKLAEGGMPDGFACAFKTEPTPSNLQVSQIVQAMVAEVGITMDIIQVDTATQIADTVAKNFEATWSQWSGRPDPDGNTYQHFHVNGGMNYGGYDNPEVNELLDQGRVVSDRDERTKIYGRVTEILQEECPAVFVWHPDEPKAMATNVQGFPPVPDGMMRFATVSLD
ncbi:MAG: peptide ABC transporter substrate-binding protein [Thermomicrobiales bacterium]|nr:peptide ABC transporter substrate-binding protein [Thermomicrobiales bacterium]